MCVGESEGERERGRENFHFVFNSDEYTVFHSSFSLSLNECCVLLFFLFTVIVCETRFLFAFTGDIYSFKISQQDLKLRKLNGMELSVGGVCYRTGQCTYRWCNRRIHIRHLAFIRDEMENNALRNVSSFGDHIKIYRYRHSRAVLCACTWGTNSVYAAMGKRIRMDQTAKFQFDWIHFRFAIYRMSLHATFDSFHYLFTKVGLARQVGRQVVACWIYGEPIGITRLRYSAN